MCQYRSLFPSIGILSTSFYYIHFSTTFLHFFIFYICVFVHFITSTMSSNQFYAVQSLLCHNQSSVPNTDIIMCNCRMCMYTCILEGNQSNIRNIIDWLWAVTTRHSDGVSYSIILSSYDLKMTLSLCVCMTVSLRVYMCVCVCEFLCVSVSVCVYFLYLRWLQTRLEISL